jgi:hypothetical protein
MKARAGTVDRYIVDDQGRRMAVITFDRAKPTWQAILPEHLLPAHTRPGDHVILECATLRTRISQLFGALQRGRS